MLALFGLVSSTSRLWIAEGPMWLTAARWMAIPAALLLAAGLVQARGRVWTLRPHLGACAAAIPLVFATDWLCHPYSILLAPVIRGEIICGAALSLLLLATGRLKYFAWFAPLAAAALAASFFVESAGRPLFSDDHATFIWRLTLLKRNFPHIPFYNPLWNGGVESRDFFATGALSLFFLGAPLWAWFEPVQVYNLIVALILFVLTPLSTYAAGRLEKLPAPAPGIAALLVLCNSVTWYKWALAYGTLGFIISTALLPPVLLLAAKVIAPAEQLSRLEACLLTALATLMLFWPFSGVVALPVIAVGLYRARTVLGKRFVPQIVLALALLNAPWMLVFWQASAVTSFVQVEQQQNGQSGAAESGGRKLNPRYKHMHGEPHKSAPLGYLRENLRRAHPLLLFLGLPGLLLLRRPSRMIFLAMSAWLLALGTAAVPLKPQLELDRMLLVLTVCLAVPAAGALVRLFEEAAASRKAAPLALASLLGGFLLAAPFTAGLVIRNRSPHHYRFADPPLRDFVRAVETAVPPGGRVLFTGCVIHHMNGGHLAPLVLYTGMPMVASSYHHDLWWYTDVLPKEFAARGDQGVERFFDLYNVRAVAAHESHWLEWLAQRPERYKALWQGGKFVLYERLHAAPNYFLEGGGAVLAQDTGRVVVRLDTPDAVLKFNYLPFLTAEPCAISGRRVAQEMTFIELRGCPTGRPVTIRAAGPFTRFVLRHFMPTTGGAG